MEDIIQQYTEPPEIGFCELTSMFGTTELSEETTKARVIPILLNTQGTFIAILSVPFPSLNDLFQTVNRSSLSGNVFLKHLMILADFGSEQLQLVNAKFKALFPSGKLEYLWKKQLRIYKFQQLPIANLTNDTLGLTGNKLLCERKLDPLLQDLAAILIFGSSCMDETTALALRQCNIGRFLGQLSIMTTIAKQRYIWMSNVTKE